ncbi:hypothetical protein ACA910_004377 [Epithemia clementina (nom. ined.)]
MAPPAVFSRKRTALFNKPRGGAGGEDGQKPTKEARTCRSQSSATTSPAVAATASVKETRSRSRNNASSVVAPTSSSSSSSGGSNSAQTSMILSPGPFDVLLGRGKGSYESEGNLRFQRVIYDALPRYALAKKKQDKTRISQDILALVKINGGKFLVHKGKLLCVASDEQARAKVSQALRHRRRQCESDGNCSYALEMFSEPLSTAYPIQLTDDSYRSNRTDETDQNAASLDGGIMGDGTRNNNVGVGGPSGPEDNDNDDDDDLLKNHGDDLESDSQAILSELSSKFSSLDLRTIFDSRASVAGTK